MSNLDMSLDDMIKMSKHKSAGPNNPRPRPRNSGGPGPNRRLPNRSSNRTTPYTQQNVQAPDTAWEHDMFDDRAAAYPVRVSRVSAIETGVKISISNLDYGVSEQDLKELFSEVGDIKRYLIHYDRSGRSKGTADIVFSRRKDAELALKKYDNVQLDGKPMKIEIVGTKTGPPADVSLASNVMYGNQNGASRSQNRGGVMGRIRGARPMRGRGRGQGQGQGRGRVEKVSAEDLDADLEKYHAEAMQTN